MKKSTKKSPAKKSARSASKSTRKSPTKNTCPSGKIRNPKTGRCVKKDGEIGRKITGKKSPARSASKSGAKSPARVEAGKRIAATLKHDPVTGRFMKKGARSTTRKTSRSAAKKSTRSPRKTSKQMTVPELKAALKDAGVTGYSKLRKDDLIKLAKKNKVRITKM